MHGRVGMLALLDPSRQEIPEYIDERRRIEEAAAAVEARFPGALRLRIADDFHQSIAAYKQFDVLLVNAVMDGLNLVAKEAPYVNARDGAVVSSVNAGAYEEIGTWTVPVDPLDVEGQADALEAALALPEEERRARLDAIRKHVRAHDLSRVDRRAAFRPRPRQYDAAAMSDLSHVDESGAVRMVDVGSKPMSRRRAVARASVRMAPETSQRSARPAQGRRARRRRSSPGSWRRRRRAI